MLTEGMSQGATLAATGGWVSDGKAKDGNGKALLRVQVVRGWGLGFWGLGFRVTTIAAITATKPVANKNKNTSSNANTNRQNNGE